MLHLLLGNSMFVKILIILSLLSIVLSLWSLKNLSTKKEINEVKNKLKKGRVIFHASSRVGAGQSSDSSSEE